MLRMSRLVFAGWFSGSHLSFLLATLHLVLTLDTHAGNHTIFGGEHPPVY